MSADLQAPVARTRTLWGLAALLAALTMVSPFSLDTFYPSFPTISAEFGLNDWQIQQSITVYMLPFAVMSLLQGPISDALGRRPIVLVGLSIYAAASFACTLAPTFAVLLVFRALQGMSAGVGMAVGRAVVRDLHEGPEAQRLISTITMIFGIAPAIAPVVGGWIHVAFGWRYVFGFMFLIGVSLVLASYLWLPETHPAERRVPLHPVILARTTWIIGSHHEFLLLAVATGVTLATILTFIGSAPAIVLRHWHLRETQFAYLFFPLIFGVIAGAWTSGRFAGRLSPGRQVVTGYAVAIAAGALMVSLHLAIAAPPLVIQQALLAVAAFGMQIVMPVLTLRMLDLFPGARGSAASVQSCVMLLLGSVCIGIEVPALNNSMLHLTIGSFVATILGCAIWSVAHRIEVRERT